MSPRNQDEIQLYVKLKGLLFNYMSRRIKYKNQVIIPNCGVASHQY